MNLKINELLFLKQYLSEQTPISILNNLSDPLNGTEMLSLMEKGVLTDHHISESALAPLQVLAQPTVCSRIALKNPYCAIEKYIYKKEDRRILLENEQGEMAVNLFENENLFIKNWEQWLGNSLIKTADFSVHLSFTELLIFLALIDYSRFNVLRGYLGDTGNKEALSIKVLEQEIGNAKSNSLVHGLKKNYGLVSPSLAQLEDGLVSLQKKGILASGAEFKLLPAYKSFAEHFLIPDNVLMMEEVRVVDANAIEAANTLALGYGLFNWLVITFEKEAVEVFTSTSAELLSAIGEHAKCE